MSTISPALRSVETLVMGSVIETASRELEIAFDRIYRERFHGLPIVNADLGVEGISFQEWQGDYVGVLITPWLMSFVMLPGKTSDWSEFAPESVITHEFPSGNYDFVVNDIDGLGICQMSALHSPMYQFKDQYSAVAAAEKAIAGLMDATQQKADKTSVEELEAILADVVPPEVRVMEEVMVAEELEEDQAASLRERIEKPVSRRDLLRGVLFGENES